MTKVRGVAVIDVRGYPRSWLTLCASCDDLRHSHRPSTTKTKTKSGVCLFIHSIYPHDQILISTCYVPSSLNYRQSYALHRRYRDVDWLMQRHHMRCNRDCCGTATVPILLSSVVYVRHLLKEDQLWVTRVDS